MEEDKNTKIPVDIDEHFDEIITSGSEYPYDLTKEGD